MKSTERSNRATQPISAHEDPFETIRAAFYERLRNDRVYLFGLGAALEHAERDPRGIFDEMRLFAHRLRGASAIFEDHELGVAADTLEQAAFSAAIGRAESSDTFVWVALEALIDLLPSDSDRRTISRKGL